MSEWEKFQLAFETSALILFAALGGALGYSYRTLRMQAKWQFARMCLEAFASGFTGLLLIFVCYEAGLSLYWTGAIVGTFSWLGANATIVVLENLIYKKLGLQNGVIEQVVVPSPTPIVTDSSGVGMVDSGANSSARDSGAESN